MVDNAREHVWIGLFSCRRFREQYICFGIHKHGEAMHIFGNPLSREN